MKAMLLAAGKGERMRPLTLTTPKPLLCVGGKPLIVHQIEKLARAGFRDLVINHAWLGEKIEAALGDGAAFGVTIHWSREGEPLETAGGIIHALPLLSGDEHFAVINTDIWTDFDYTRLHQCPRKQAHLVMVDNPPQHPKGDFHLDADGTLHDRSDVSRLTYSGISVLSHGLFAGAASGKQALAPFLRAAMAHDQVTGEHHCGAWHDIGTTERLMALDKLLSGK